MGDDELDEASKLKIAANFINYSPPGQIQKVVEDVKVLLGGHVPRSTLDSLMVKVNSTSFLAVDVPGEGRKVLITPFGDLGDGTFLDPMGLQRLTIDHGKQVCTSAEALSGAEAASLDAHEKGQVDAAMTRYAANKLPDAVVTTYCKVVGTATHRDDGHRRALVQRLQRLAQPRRAIAPIPRLQICHEVNFLLRDIHRLNKFTQHLRDTVQVQ